MDGAKSAVSHGWLFARPACTIILKMPQAPEGLISRTRLFASFLVFSKMTAPGRGFPVSCATAHRSPERMLLEWIERQPRDRYDYQRSLNNDSGTF